VFNSTVSASTPFPGGASASQFSQIAPFALSGSLHTGAFGSVSSPPAPAGSGSGEANSVFRVSFSVSDAVPYTIQGSLGATIDFFGLGQSSVALELRDALGIVLFSASDTGVPFPHSVPFSGDGVLEPGEYLLEALASAKARPGGYCCDGSSDGDLSFDFRVVPEPSTALELGLGLAVLGRRRRAAATRVRPRRRQL
jgi:hypothetical protein